MNKWWYFRFRINWPQNQEPRWWIDIFIFDTIVRPILRENHKEIVLWRIHRRANRDQNGHQLSFLCYSKDETARFVNERIISNEGFSILKKAGLLERYFWEEEGRENKKINVEDTSDKMWPIEIQKSWPLFIMGVSQMLLELIEQMKRQSEQDMPTPNFSAPMHLIEGFYSELNNKLAGIWQTKGSHAFFHHLNALFGYAPLVVHLRRSSAVLTTF